MYTFSYGKHSGQNIEQVKNKDSQYLLYIKNKFKNPDVEILQYIKDNEEEIIKNAEIEHADFLRDACDGEVSIEY